MANRIRVCVRFTATSITTCALVALVGCSGEMARGDDEGGGPDAGSPGADAGSEPDAAPVEPALLPALDASHYSKTLTDSDLDCFWEKGYRHLVIGTQVDWITREQIAIATRGGFTVDLYVYLHWNQVEDEMDEARQIFDDYPQLGRIWLDIEDPPGSLGANQLIDRIDAGIAVVGDRPHGIYTSRGFWTSYMNDTDVYAQLPLWYAHYDLEASLDSWAADQFGGWDEPTGKQWDDHIPGTCSRAVDKNIMWVAATPEVVVDREMVDDGDAPAEPEGMWPDQGAKITTVYVRPTVPTLRDATGYDFELEEWTGTAWAPYWAPTSEVSSFEVYPVDHDRAYRWRVRGENAYGAGPWSPWAWFAFGAPTKLPPDAGN